MSLTMKEKYLMRELDAVNLQLEQYRASLKHKNELIDFLKDTLLNERKERKYGWFRRFLCFKEA